MCRLVCGLLCASFLAGSAFGQTKATLQGGKVGTNGWFQMQIGPVASQVYSVETSSDFATWNAISTLLGTDLYTNSALPFIDASSGSSEPRFYRVRTTQAGPAHDWKNQVYYPNDPFLSLRTSWDQAEVLWIKFAIKTNEPHRVYFQDSVKYVFHYDFAKARLPEFQAMTRAQFDEVSLHTNNQQVVLGTVLYAPLSDMRQAAVQFVGLDAYSREQVAGWFDIVKAAIAPTDSLKVVYIPTFEQARVAQENQAFFGARGIEISTLSSWTPGNDCYAPGWAIGALKYFPANEVQAAYLDGRLLPTDILLIDAVPAELPYLAGIISLAPATPNSHVAILAKSQGIPFVYLADPELRKRAETLQGKQIVLDSIGTYGGCDITLVDVSAASSDILTEIKQLKAPPVVTITPKTRLGSYTTNTETLYPADIKYVGGKAANFGFIRRTIPANSPTAIAITFDLWDEFMNQTVATGKTLREEINQRLAAYPAYPPNFAALRADLTAIRDMIEDSTIFTQPQMDGIATALLGRFDPNRKIRFRSSTNVEDSESFTGAGLYDSYSGCLADDQDGDTTGPSICDSEEARERGVFRAIRKVYASFYNENAFLERLRHGIDESQVGMGILVHHSSPDPTEMANGVATVRFEKNPSGTSYVATMVTQKGAVSVTNPDGTAIPEVVQVNKYFDTPYVDLRQRSSLVPLGGYVLNWGKDGEEYKQFSELFSKVALAFQQYFPAKTNYTLDFEYKKIVPGELRVKQVRELPSINPDEQVQTYLLNYPAEWCVFQGEYGDVFANHRLKSKFQLTTRELKLTPANLAQTIYGATRFEYADGGNTNVLTGVPSAWPNPAHTADPLRDSWDAGTALPRRWTLETTIAQSVPATYTPVLTLNDAQVILMADYATPQIGLDWMGALDNTITNESARLINCPKTNVNSILVTRELTVGGVHANIQLYWPEPPKGATAGYTAPLVAWKETVLTGVASQPIVLRGYYSQTYRPQHHNFSEDFVFEPRLEPGLSSEILAELESKNIRSIYVRWGGFDSPHEIFYIGADGIARPVGK